MSLFFLQCSSDPYIEIPHIVLCDTTVILIDFQLIYAWLGSKCLDYPSLLLFFIFYYLPRVMTEVQRLDFLPLGIRKKYKQVKCTEYIHNYLVFPSV